MTPEQRIRQLELENEKIKREAAELRSSLRKFSGHERRIERAYADALLLASWSAGGIFPSRRFARLHEMSQRRWQNACGLLRMARVLDRHRHWITTDLAVVEKRLERAATQAKLQPEGYFARLNRHARNET